MELDRKPPARCSDSALVLFAVGSGPSLEARSARKCRLPPFLSLLYRLDSVSLVSRVPTFETFTLILGRPQRFLIGH